MANTKISALTANTNPTGLEELVYAYNNANGKMTLNTMKAFVGGAGITTLNADANIWELSAGIYETTYKLYYKSGEEVPVIGGSTSTKKQMLFVTEEGTGENGFFVFNVGHLSSSYRGMAAFGYSVSSSIGECNKLGARDETLSGAGWSYTGGLSDIGGSTFTHIISNFVDSSSTLRLDGSVYTGMTYTIYVASYASGNTATISTGTGVTNPLNITLPSGSNKPFVIKLLATSSSSAIITGCTMQA